MICKDCKEPLLKDDAYMIDNVREYCGYCYNERITNPHDIKEDLETIYGGIYMLEKISQDLIGIEDVNLAKTLDIISQDLKQAVKNIELQSK